EQRLSPLRRVAVGGAGARHGGFGGGRHWAFVGAALRAGRRRPGAAVRRSAPAPRRLPDVVSAARRPHAGALVPHAARSPAARAGGGRPPLRARPGPHHPPAPPPRGGVPVPLSPPPPARRHRAPSPPPPRRP